jgi:hypothetical protein
LLAYEVKWTALDMTHWQTRIQNSYRQILKVYPDGCLDWLKEFRPDQVALLKASVAEIKRTYTSRDSQGLDAALTAYRESHLKAFAEFLALSQTANAA